MSSSLLATVLIYGVGAGPQIAYPSGAKIKLATGTAPIGVAVDGAGDIYFTDGLSCLLSEPCVYEIPVGGGQPKPIGQAQNNLFDSPTGVAVDGAGNVYIADSSFPVVIEVPAGDGAPAYLGSTGNLIAGVALDRAGNIFLSGSCSPWSPGTTYSSFVGKEPAGGGPQLTLNPVVDGLSWNCPAGIAVDFAGNLYVADSGNNRVIEVPAPGGGAPFAVGTGFSNPQGVAVDGAGNLYVADTGNSRLAEVPAGSAEVVTLATLSTLGVPPYGVAVDGQGNIFVAGYSASASSVLELPRSQPPALTVTTAANKPLLPQSASIQNIGNEPLIFPLPVTGNNPSYPAHFLENIGDPNLCASFKPVAPGASCDISLFISEAVTGTFSGSVVLTDNAFGQANGTQKIEVKGNAIEKGPLFWPSPHPVFFGTALGAAQLNAQIQAPAGVGWLAYEPPAGTILGVGTHTLKVIFTPKDTTRYLPNTATVTLVVKPVPQAAPPTFTPAPGTYASAQKVTIADATPAAIIYYTTDGTTPTTSSTPYSGAINVSQTESIKAIAIGPVNPESAVATATYTIK